MHAAPLQPDWNAAIQAASLQHPCHCNTGCATATRAVPLQHVLCCCNTGSNAATKAEPLQHGLCHCNTAVLLRQSQLRHCNSGCAIVTRAMLQHGLCRCNTECAAATGAVPLLHGMCRCNTSYADATRAVLLKHRLCCCNTGCAAATRAGCNTGCTTDSEARAVPLQHGPCRYNTGSATATLALPLQLWLRYRDMGCRTATQAVTHCNAGCACGKRMCRCKMGEYSCNTGCAALTRHCCNAGTK